MSRAPEPGGEAKVFCDGEVAIERRLLKHEPDAASDLEILAHDVVPGDARRAATRGQQRREDMNGCGLARAVRPEKAEELALTHLQIEGVERANRAEVLAETAGCDRGGGHPLAAMARDAGAARYAHSAGGSAAAAAPSAAATASSTRRRCGESEQTGSVTPASPVTRNA